MKYLVMVLISAALIGCGDEYPVAIHSGKAGTDIVFVTLDARIHGTSSFDSMHIVTLFPGYPRSVDWPTFVTANGTMAYTGEYFVQGLHAGRTIETVRTDGSDRRVIAKIATDTVFSDLLINELAISPDGATVAYFVRELRLATSPNADGIGLYAVGLDGREPYTSRLVKLYDRMPSWAYGVRFSHDGRSLAFTSDTALYMVAIDGSRDCRIPLPPKSGRASFGPFWSPDGSRIAMLVSGGTSASVIVYDVRAALTTGIASIVRSTQLRTAGAVISAGWVSGSDKIFALVRDAPGTQVLCVVGSERDEQSMVPILDGRCVFSCDWSSDGEKLLYVSTSGSSVWRTLGVLDLSTGRVRELVTQDIVEKALWAR